MQKWKIRKWKVRKWKIRKMKMRKLTESFGRLFMDNVDEENMLELSPKFFTFDANITLLFLKVEGSFGY